MGFSSLHELEGPAPARLGNKMDDQISDLPEPVTERRVGVLVTRRLKRPVD
jgi:hypothetical protein